MTLPQPDSLPPFPVGRDDQVAEIGRIGRLRAPAEACGVMLPAEAPCRGQWVWEMPNRSDATHDSAVMSTDDIRIQLAEWLVETPREAVNRMVLWHTHPGGHVGPSQMDMELAVPGLMLLVVALGADGHDTPSYYRAHVLASGGV